MQQPGRYDKDETREGQMNRWILTSFLLFAVFSVGASQSIKRCGAKVGATSSTWDWQTGGSTNQGVDARLGIDVGAYVEWFNVPAFSLISELHFVQKGMKEDIPITTQQYPNGTGEFVKHSIRLDYLSFGILPKVRFETGVAEVYGIAGLRVDISLSNNVAVEGREPLRTQSAQSFQYLVDRFKNPEVGGTVGIGVQSDSLLPLPVGIEVRYSPNFQNGYSTSIWTIRNTSFEFLLIVSM